MMLRTLAKRCFSSSSPRAHNVAVLGAAGGIGQPLSLLLKLEPRVKTLHLYDISPVTPGVAADLSHINSAPQVVGFAGADQLGAALKGMETVVIPAGVPRKPGMTRDDLFNINASIVRDLSKGIAKHCPSANILVISNPVNSTVPIVAEVMKAAGVYNPKRLFGVTTLDIVRANTFVAGALGLDLADVDVTVVGGHAGITILPLLSQIKGAKFTHEQIEALTHRIQFGGDEVVQAKAGAGSATLSMAYAAAVFTRSLLSALDGERGISECAFVQSDVASTPFFSSRVELGREGVTKIHGVGELSDFEKQMYDKMIPELQASINKGIAFSKTN